MPRDGKSQSCAHRLLTCNLLEWFEYAGIVFFGDTNPSILHGDDNTLWFLTGTQSYFAVACVLKGVVEQINHDLANAAIFSQYFGQCCREFFLEYDSGPTRYQT